MSHGRAGRLSAGVAALLAVAVAVAGCGADVEPPAKTPSAAQTQPPTATLGDQPSGATGTGPGAADGATSREAKLKPPLAFHVRRRAQLRATPGGRVVATIKTRTEFKSPTILAVAGRKPGWVLVRTSVRKHHVGWLPTGAGVLFSQPRTIVIDLSKRTLSVFHRGHLTDTYKVAIGTKATPTPRGKFAVTDRLTTGNANGDYGCCILALTGHQPKIAQGWGGGDRVAIHATPHTWTLGQRVSHGCVRATNKALHRLMRQVRLGTPVTVHL
jgi:lipoprotein-anchoring transpeptidase ErfK/SrfK